MRCIFYLLILANISYYAKGQSKLLYYAVADSARYSDADGNFVLPGLKLKKSRNQELFYKDILIYNNEFIPKNYCAFQYEIFNNEFVVVTFQDSTSIGVSEPMWIHRKNLQIIELKNPKIIYTAGLDGIQILTDEATLNKLTDYASNMYIIESIDLENLKIIFKGYKNRKIEFKLEQIKNPLVE